MSKKKKRRRLKKKIFTTGLIIAVIIISICSLLFICSNFKSKNVEQKRDEDTTTSISKSLSIVDVNSNSRPYAVMINNISTARPYQSGLDKAMIIYEIIVEGGITRLMAIYKDADVSRIGSVRSSRHYFLDYALENDAIYVHIGWSPQAKSDITSLGVDNINGLYDSAFWKDNSLNISTEHRSFTSTDKIASAVSSKNYRTTTNKDLLLNYSADEVDLSNMDGAIVANNISITYSSSVVSQYKYDETTKRYLRSVNGVAHKDYVSGEQYSFKNIITYQLDNSSISGDKKNRQDINTVGSGTGYYITDGYAVPITWEKSSRSSQTIYKYMNGEEIDVNDGNTFIQIQPKSKELVIN